MSARRPDAGFSLIELLIALSIMGLAVVGVVGLIGTLIVTGDRARMQADAEALARSAADKVAAMPFVNCGEDLDVGALPPAPYGLHYLTTTGTRITPVYAAITSGVLTYGPAIPCVSDTPAEQFTVRVADENGAGLARAVVTKDRPQP